MGRGSPRRVGAMAGDACFLGRRRNLRQKWPATYLTLLKVRLNAQLITRVATIEGCFLRHGARARGTHGDYSATIEHPHSPQLITHVCTSGVIHFGWSGLFRVSHLMFI